MWVRMSKMVLFLLDLYLINPFLTFVPLLSSTPNWESCIMCQTVWWFIWLFVLIHGWVFPTFCNNLEMNFCVCFVASLWCLCAWYNTSMPSAEEWRVTHCWLHCCVIVYYIVCYIYLYACVPFISGVMMLQHTATLTFTITFTGQSECWLLLYRTHKIATKKKKPSKLWCFLSGRVYVALCEGIIAIWEEHSTVFFNLVFQDQIVSPYH